VDKQIGVEESKYRVTGNSPIYRSGRVTWPAFEILGPRHISGRVWARNVKFGMQIHHQRY